MNGDLNVSTAALNNVGGNFKDIAGSVRQIFSQMQATIDQVTGNDSWSGDARNAFLDKFNNIKPRLETHLQQLEALGPAVNQTATAYSNAESDNVGMMH